MYNKQEWKDEIPDLTRPIMDPSTGKQKTDPQTGRPLFELVQVGTRITSTRLNTMEGGIDAAHTLVEQLAKEMGGNFVAVIDGVMGLSCTAEGLKATWTAGIAYVGGRRYQVAAGEMPLNPTQGQYLYVDIDGVVKKTTSQTTAKKGLTIFYVATDTSGVISSSDQRVNVSLEEILKRLDNVQIPDASLTDKGKVQLTNSTTSTSQELAPTAKALNDARQAAIAAAATSAASLYVPKDNGINILANSSAEFGLFNWRNNRASGPFYAVDEKKRGLPGSFAQDAETPSFQLTVLSSEEFELQPSTKYTLSADFYSLGSAAGDIYVQLYAVTSTASFTPLNCNSNSDWHRKSMVITTNSTENAKFSVRICVPLSKAAMLRKVARIMLNTGDTAADWNQGANDQALLSYVDAVKPKRNVWGPM